MICKYFKIQELVSPDVYKRMGNNAWWLFDPRLLQTADNIRQKFGTMIINDWSWGGQFRFRGLRSIIDSQAPKADFSLHRFGMAIDCHFKNVSVTTVRKYIIDHPSQFPDIRGLELDVSWLHFDTRNADKLITFKG